mmetsp:Transcript_44422/g.125751  ORF Transcript_44422/g.125751 Transcript_44422/m.125751 type:complete len:296 (-) Transcript_44422:8-895(-)
MAMSCCTSSRLSCSRRSRMARAFSASIAAVARSFSRRRSSAASSRCAARRFARAMSWSSLRSASRSVRFLRLASASWHWQSSSNRCRASSTCARLRSSSSRKRRTSSSTSARRPCHVRRRSSPARRLASACCRRADTLSSLRCRSACSLSLSRERWSTWSISWTRVHSSGVPPLPRPANRSTYRSARPVHEVRTLSSPSLLWHLVPLRSVAAPLPCGHPTGPTAPATAGCAPAAAWCLPRTVGGAEAGPSFGARAVLAPPGAKGAGAPPILFHAFRGGDIISGPAGPRPGACQGP